MKRQAQAVQERQAIFKCKECEQTALFDNRGVCSRCLEEHYKVCEVCECSIHEDAVREFEEHDENTSTSSIHVYCDSCFYEEHDYCNHCGEAHYTDDMTWLNEGKHEGLYCKECFPKYGFKCADCGEIHSINHDYSFHNDNDELICESCGEYYSLCDFCGCTIHQDNAYWTDDECFCEECYNADIEMIDSTCDIPEYREAQRMPKEKREEFVDFRNSWREEFIPCVAEFYAVQLMKELNRRPDGLNMTELAPMDALTGEYKINIYASIYNALNMNAIDELHCSPYWNGFMDKNDTREAQIIHDLKKFFMDYIFIACVGEARHVYNYSQHDGFIPEWLPIASKKEYCSREDLWSYGYYLLELCKSNPEQYNFASYCKELYRVFDENEWGSSYGGAKWANIIGHLCRYLNNEINDTIFVDQSISLVHNGSLFVDKIGVSVSKLKRLLDLKFAAQIKDIPEVIGYIKTEYIMYRYEEAYKFACAILEIEKIEEKTIEVKAKKVTPEYVDIEIPTYDEVKHNAKWYIEHDQIMSENVSYEQLPLEVKQELKNSVSRFALNSIKESGFLPQCDCALCHKVKQAIVKAHDKLSVLHVENLCGTAYSNLECTNCYSVTCGLHSSLAFVVYKQFTGIDLLNGDFRTQFKAHNVKKVA